MRRGRTKTFRALEKQEREVYERKRKNHRGRVQKNARTSEFQDGGRMSNKSRVQGDPGVGRLRGNHWFLVTVPGRGLLTQRGVLVKQMGGFR